MAIKIAQTEYTVTVGKRGEESKSFVFDASEYPDNVVEKVFAYGMQRIFNDKCGGADKTLEDKATAVETQHDEFLKGIIAKVRSTTGKPAYWKYLAAIIRELMGEESKEKYKEAEDKTAFIQGIFDDQDEKLQAQLVEKAEARLKADQESRAEVAKLQLA